MRDLVIRPAAEEDRERLIDLKHELNLWEIGNAQNARHPLAGDLDPSREAAIGVINRDWGKLESEEGAIFVAVHVDEVVGYCSLHVERGSTSVKEDFRNHGYVAGLAVTAAHRGKGVGTALLGAARTLFVKKGLRRMTIAAAVYNEGAQRLYERVGFLPLYTTLCAEIADRP